MQYPELKIQQNVHADRRESIICDQNVYGQRVESEAVARRSVGFLCCGNRTLSKFVSDRDHFVLNRLQTFHKR